MTEFGDVVDEADVVVGRATRAEIRERNLLHRAVFVVVRDRRGRIFVHRRTADRDVHPSTYDLAVGGLVRAGETYEAAAARELQEELGLTTACRWIGRFRLELPDLRVIAGVFETECDGEVRLDPSELAWGGFIAPDELAGKLDEWPFAPGCKDFHASYLTGVAPPNDSPARA